MKLVEFAVDMAPHVAGECRLVPDELARILQSEGAVTNVLPWPLDAAPETPRKRPEKRSR